MKILINASNLHVGGGVQVAASFITELYELNRFDLSIVCSSKVQKNVAESIDCTKFNRFDICDVHATFRLSREQKDLFESYDVCFTVFGPFYQAINVKTHICGFAQAWIAYPNNVAYDMLPFKEKWKNKIKFKIQSMFFKNYDHLIVEQQHVKKALLTLGYNEKNISVVNNCISKVFEDGNQWEPINVNENKLISDVVIGFIGRAYSHKNVNILKDVNSILISKYNFMCDFVFTFTKDEMHSLGFDEISNFSTVGEININQCPRFYTSIDALIFPSLLECFSVSPIEALKMKTTILASNYSFVEEVCKESAFYFDPLDSYSIAETIYNCFQNEEVRLEKISKGYELVNELPSARDRAVSNLKIIENRH
ncbi:glycosyltransferase [Vibrio splendidus]